MSGHREEKKIKDKLSEAEVIRVNKPLQPWNGNVRDYNPNLSLDFKKRQKLKGRDKILLIVEKQIAQRDGSETVEFTLELSSEGKNKEQNENKKTSTELHRIIEKQRAVKKSLQEILAKEHKLNKSLEKDIHKKKQQWSLERESLNKENLKLKDAIVALESQLKILDQRLSEVVSHHKAKLKELHGQGEQEKRKAIHLQQQMELEQKRRKSLHHILNESAKESKEDLEKLLETNREREILMEKVAHLESEKSFWFEQKNTLENNVQKLEEKLEDLEQSIKEKEIITKKYERVQNEVSDLQNEKLELQNQIAQYATINKNKFLIGEKIFGSRGGYVVTEKFKQGGMGELYLAKQIENDETVVVKTLQFSDEGDENKKVLRFIQEARMMLSFEHPNLVSALDFYQTPDKVFLVMEYVEGVALEDICNNKVMKVEEAANIILQVARALNYLGTLGIVHRDVKPANIMITTNRNAKLMDFGILKTVHSKCMLTTSGIIMGTPYYLSPEQITESFVDIKSDVYSLGITFYQLVVGKVPFQGENQVEVIAKRLTKTPPRALKENPNLNKTICNLIERMMERKPARRPTPLDIIEDLESFLGITC